MQDLVLWAGPVAPFQVPGATVPGAREKFFQCRGDVAPRCGDIADGWMDSSGRRLPTLLASLGLGEGDVGRIFLGAFSAGGSTWKRLLEHAQDRARVTAVMLHDATYSSGGTAANPEPIEGFTLYALDALHDPAKLLVATSSAGANKSYGSGDQVLAATQRDIEKRSGVLFQKGGVLPVPDQPLELATAPTGNIIFGYYGFKGGGHGYHPKMAPDYWRNVLQPWAAGVAPPVVPVPPGPGLAPPPLEPAQHMVMPIASFVVGTVIGFGAVLLVEAAADA